MSRCKACDAILSDAELAMTNTETGEPEDMCLVCLGHAFDYLSEDETDILPIEEDTTDDLSEW